MIINFYENKEKYYEEQIKQIYEIALRETIKIDNICVNIVFVTPEKIKEMNKEYRNIDKVTDVLSFPMVEDFTKISNEIDFFTGEVEIGDIYINPERAKQQALEYGHSYQREICFLALHGFLHLLGYDHMVKEDEIVMFGLQDKILELAKIGRD